MEPTVTLTFTQAFTIIGVVAGLVGTLFGAWLTLAFRRQPVDEVARQKQADHEAECVRYREMMQKFVTEQFAAVRSGIEGLYRQRGWFR